MSTSLSVSSVIEKNRLSSDVPWLILLDIDVIDPASSALVETLHIVRNTESVTFNGHEYVAANFEIESKSEAGTQHSIQLTIEDHTLTVQRRIQDYGGGVGFNVTVMVVNAARLDAPAEVLEYFEIVGSETSSYAVTFTLGAENNITKTFPRRKQTKDYCQWRYKSLECGYDGPLPSCDLSLKGPNGCAAHQNVIHFGAFPALNTRDTNYG